ncbi:MAG TPA: sialate O-acetylesterase [Thermoguttaceae bacterium]
MKIRCAVLCLYTTGLILTACFPTRLARLSLAQLTVTPTPFLPKFASVELPQDQMVSVSIENENTGPDFGVFAPPTETSTPTPTPMPLPLVVLMGQSNMSGRGIVDEQWSNPLVWEFGNDYQWALARDPIDSPAGQIDAVSVDYDAGHSPATRFGDLYAERFGEFGLVPCAKNSSTITEWQLGGGLYSSCLNRIVAAGGNVVAILFFQGEAEAENVEGSAKVRAFAQWGELFQKLVTDLRRDLNSPKLPIIFAQIGAFPTKHYLAGPWNEVRQQQADFQMECVAMTKTEDLSDGDVHFTSEAYDVIGTRFAEALFGLDCK